MTPAVASAYAKLNLALVVGPLRSDGKHEVVTVLQTIDLHDDVELEPGGGLAVDGFEDDTLVRAALEALAERAGAAPAWRVRVEKRIPVAAGLGGGSSDAAAALRLANEGLPEPLPQEELHEIATGLGADVPFFLREGSQLGTGDGSDLSPLELPADYVVLVVLPFGEQKPSTASVYLRFDDRRGYEGFDERCAELRRVLEGVEVARDLSRLPRNDLAWSSLSDEFVRLGAFRADVTGAGPAVYGLFENEPTARRAVSSLHRVGPTWLSRPLPEPPRPPANVRSYHGAWPSGKATGFGPVIPGSNPGAPAVDAGR
jgi:4-diphosphocytidyl-2-C-methyl-D-erythritol kinase